MERFFRLCGEAGRVKDPEDTLLHRYSSAALDIFKMSPKEAYNYIRAAIDNDLDDKLYLMWLAFVPRMTKETYVGFGEFKDNLTGRNIDQRSTEEILAEAEEIKRRLSDGG